jgi:hypothetical protein
MEEPDLNDIHRYWAEAQQLKRPIVSVHRPRRPQRLRKNPQPFLSG